MRQKFVSILLVILFFISCKTGNSDKSANQQIKKQVAITAKRSVAILPFKGVDTVLINELKQALQKQLTVDFFVLDKTALPSYAFYKPRQRYIADSLLVFLKATNRNKYEKIIGITVKDISTRKGDIENWGILGLGFCPGEACVVSTFRAGKNKISYKDFLRRITTLALHELGHTYGLEHCPVQSCLMKDAEGKMNLDDGDAYCNKCRNYLLSNGILK